jgi:hypothetical protein
VTDPDEKLRRIRATERFKVYCECVDEACEAEVELTLDEWDAIRERPGAYPIAPGHPVAEDEQIVEGNDRFEVAAPLKAK